MTPFPFFVFFVARGGNNPPTFPINRDALAGSTTFPYQRLNKLTTLHPFNVQLLLQHIRFGFVQLCPYDFPRSVWFCGRSCPIVVSLQPNEYIFTATDIVLIIGFTIVYVCKIRHEVKIQKRKNHLRFYS